MNGDARLTTDSLIQSMTPSFAAHMRQFIEGSCALSGHQDEENESHLEACLEARRDGLMRSPLKEELLKRWSKLLGTDLDPGQAKAVLGQLNGALASVGSSPGDGRIVELLADSLRWSRGRLPVRVGHLLLIYVASWTKALFPILRADEAQELEEALSEAAKARQWMAKKYREAVLDPSGVIYRAEEVDALQGSYLSDSGKSLIVQWNELAVAEQGWR